MGKFTNAVGVATELIAEGRFTEITRRSLGLLYEQKLAFGLRRDLTIPVVTRRAKIPITIRKIIDSDLPVLFPTGAGALSRREAVELATRRAMYDAGVSQCYVAVDAENDAPCYFQWLLDHRQNDFLQSYFPKTWFPVLAPDEALLENAYTPVAYRGKGIMSEAMTIIAEQAAGRYAITFVEAGNVPSLKGCANAGFSPYLARKESRFLFNALNSRRFEALALPPV